MQIYSRPSSAQRPMLRCDSNLEGRSGNRRWLRSFSVVLPALVVFMAIGCGTLTYKSGSTGSDYEAASKRCQAAGRAASPDFEHCLEEQGWSVKQLAAPAAAGETSKPAPAAQPQAPVAADDVVPRPQINDVSGAVSATRSPAGEPQPVATPTAPQPAAAANWFKFGGTADQLTATKQRCAAAVDPADRPQPGSDLLSAAMLECMRAAGWRPF